MRVEAGLTIVTSERSDAGLTIIGPAGSGKTSALAERAVQYARSGGNVIAICPDDVSSRAFAASLGDDAQREAIKVDTLAGHAAAWMRAEYAAAGVAPDLRVVGSQAARRVLDDAARGLLDLEWPWLHEPDFDLDLPFLSRPDTFFDETAELVRMLRRACISPGEFERACHAGVERFYGDGSALPTRLRDPELHAHASRRDRQALLVSVNALTVQARAERGLARLLSELYARYVAALPRHHEWCEEDVVAHALAWLDSDPRAAAAIARTTSAVIVDDGDDADPNLPRVLSALRGAGVERILVAGFEESRIEGMSGRRSVLGDAETAQHPRVTLPPPAPVEIQTQRVESEAEEIQRLAAACGALLDAGAVPSDIAILARTVESAAAYARALQDRGLPVLAPADVFDAPLEVDDLLALAAIVGDQFDHAHLLRVLFSPLLALSDRTVWKLCGTPEQPAQLSLDVGAEAPPRRGDPEVRPTLLAANVFTGAVDADLPDAALELLTRFRTRYLHWQERALAETPAQAIRRLAHEGGFVRRWKASAPFRRGRLLDDLERVVEAIADAQTREPQLSMNEGVTRLEGGQIQFRRAASQPDAIACEPIVRTKGRRWPHVFVVGVAYEHFPKIYMPRGLAFSRPWGLIPRENVAGGPKRTAKYAWFYAKHAAKARYLEQERRILRYGMSRANRSLVVSGYGRPPRWAAAYDLLSLLGV